MSSPRISHKRVGELMKFSLYLLLLYWNKFLFKPKGRIIPVSLHSDKTRLANALLSCKKKRKFAFKHTIDVINRLLSSLYGLCVACVGVVLHPVWLCHN